jgi:hypothetical protein
MRRLTLVAPILQRQCSAEIAQIYAQRFHAQESYFLLVRLRERHAPIDAIGPVRGSCVGRSCGAEMSAMLLTSERLQAKSHFPIARPCRIAPDYIRASSGSPRHFFGRQDCVDACPPRPLLTRENWHDFAGTTNRFKFIIISGSGSAKQYQER